jgi:DNA-binding NtrC family response regulator
VLRVGSTKPVRVDLNVVAATNRDLRKMIAEGQFREDLFYRISMVEIALPSLAQRLEDLPLLTRHFLESFSAQYGKRLTGLTPKAQKALAEHSWPGNIRELENVLGSACIMADGPLVDFDDLPPSLREPGSTCASGPAAAASEEFSGEIFPLEVMQRRYARRVLERCRGNKSQAAEVLQISRTTLYKLLDESSGGA